MENQKFDFILSKKYLLLSIFILITTSTIIYTLPFNTFLRLFLFIFVCLYGAYILNRYCFLRHPYSVTSIKRMDHHKWQIQIGKQSVEAALQPDSVATHIISVLRFKLIHSFFPVSCVIFKDSLPANQYKQLLVVLKMCG